MNNNYDQNDNFSGSSADSDQNGLESLEKIIAAFKKQIPIEKFSDHGLYTYEELMEMNEKQANIEAERKLRASHNRHKNELRMQTSLNKSCCSESDYLRYYRFRKITFCRSNHPPSYQPGL